MVVKKFFKKWSPYGSEHPDETLFDGEAMMRFAESYHQAKSKEEAVDITNKVETLIGYLELWYRRYSPPSGFFAVIEEAKEWLAAFGKEGEG